MWIVGDRKWLGQEHDDVDSTFGEVTIASTFASDKNITHEGMRSEKDTDLVNNPTF